MLSDMLWFESRMVAIRAAPFLPCRTMIFWAQSASLPVSASEECASVANSASSSASASKRVAASIRICMRAVYATYQTCLACRGLVSRLR